MGIIQPPWVSKKWFMETPFNYCDHFGDKVELALMCKICKDEIEWKEKIKKEGRDPNSWDEVFKEVGKNFALAMAMLQKQAKEMGIDLNAQPDTPEPKKPNASRYKIYQLVTRYCHRVEKIIKELEYVLVETNKPFVLKALDILSHSGFYAMVKVNRAIVSRWEEKKNKDMREIADSKTSVLLAYMAIERNSRALFRLAQHRPLIAIKRRLLKLAKISIDLAEIVKQEFFPKDKVIYQEFGCDSYNRIFKPIPKV